MPPWIHLSCTRQYCYRHNKWSLCVCAAGRGIAGNAWCSSTEKKQKCSQYNARRGALYAIIINHKTSTDICSYLIRQLAGRVFSRGALISSSQFYERVLYFPTKLYDCIPHISRAKIADRRALEKKTQLWRETDGNILWSLNLMTMLTWFSLGYVPRASMALAHLLYTFTRLLCYKRRNNMFWLIWFYWALTFLCLLSLNFFFSFLCFAYFVGKSSNHCCRFCRIRSFYGCVKWGHWLGYWIFN